VVDFLSVYSIPQENVVFGRHPDGRITGEAYVMFRSTEEAENALNSLQNGEIQGHYVELFRSTEEDFQRMSSQAAAPAAADMGKISRVQMSHVLRLTGVPCQANVDHIVQFLADFGIDRSRVTMAQGVGGCPTVEAYVQFRRAAEADGALHSKNGQEILGSCIQLFLSCQQDFDNNVPYSMGTMPAGGSYQDLKEENERLLAEVHAVTEEALDMLAALRKSHHEGISQKTKELHRLQFPDLPPV